MAEYENMKIMVGVKEGSMEAKDRGLFDFLGKEEEDREDKPHGQHL